MFFLDLSEVYANWKVPLASVIVTLDDLNSKALGGPFTVTEEKVWVIDRSGELSKRCPVDCAKFVWYTPVRYYWPDGYRRLTIVLIEMGTDQEARMASMKLYQQLQGIKSRDFYDYTSGPDWQVLQMPENTWALYNGTYSIGTSYGPVLIFLSMKMRGFYDVDGIGEIYTLTDLVRIQLEKLEQSRYGP